jgi:hypothetical protein
MSHTVPQRIEAFNVCSDRLWQFLEAFNEPEFFGKAQDLQNVVVKCLKSLCFP